jgi:GTPase SAR1 family protein
MRIALVGKAGSGKSTIAKELVEKDGYLKLAFAAPLKYFAEEILMRPLDKTDPLDRKFLQYLGTELGRARQKDIWIKHFDLSMQSIIEDMEDDYLNFVVDDCRFINEAEYLKSKDFLIIKLIGRQWNLEPSLTQHPSEAEQDAIVPDFTVDTSTTLSETVCELFDKIGEYLHEHQ